jgi:phospholipid-binding lipoprotein MlaA
MPRPLLLLPLLVLAAGCAGRQPPRPDYDPWEGYNRKMFAFNDWLDRNALEPVARGWNYIVPEVVQRHITLFFDNLRFPANFANSLLQGKPRGVALALWRFQINTVFGGLGFFDVAKDLDMPPQNEDFGQTLGVWGIAPGPYFVLPILGPSSPRDTVGLAGDFLVDFYQYFIVIPGITTGASVINIINQRSRLLDTVENAKEASLDYYTFVRNAYVQRRWKLIHDQAPPTTETDDELYNAEVYEGYLEGEDEP